MKIVHRVFFRYRKEMRKRLDKIGVDYSDDPVVFDMEEADARWPALKTLLDECELSTTCTTVFTHDELSSARWLRMRSDWHHGYPMPDSDFGYRNLTYDLTEYCEKCGIGARQKAPFRMKGEPKWGRRNILQLNWVFDEYFVTPEAWEAVFAPLGIECRPVLAHRLDTELKTVVQLRLETVLEDELSMGDHPFETCESCRRKKYLPFTRGMFPAMTKRVEGVHAVKTKEWFGSGASANRGVLVSQTVFVRVQESRMKGVGFGVVAPG